MLSVIQSLTQSELATRWPLRILCSHDGGSLARRLLLAWKALWQCLWLLAGGRVRLLHIHVAERGSFFRKSLFVLLGRLFHTPIILHMHGAEFRSFYAGQAPWVRRYVRWIIGMADQVVALSRDWVSFYAELSPTPVEAIANFVPLPPASSQGPTTASALPEILYLGRFGERKGIFDLIEAVKPLYESHAGLQIWCGGDGEIERVRSLVASHGMSERFHVLGWVDADKRATLLRQCRIFVLPSYAEGLPVAILEAMGAGLAILATRVGGIPEMLADGAYGILVEPGDVDGLRQALQRLLADAGTRERLGMAARKRFLQVYSADAVVPHLDALYRRLTGENRP